MSGINAAPSRQNMAMPTIDIVKATMNVIELLKGEIFSGDQSSWWNFFYFNEVDANTRIHRNQNRRFLQ